MALITILFVRSDDIQFPERWLYDAFLPSPTQHRAKADVSSCAEAPRIQSSFSVCGYPHATSSLAHALGRFQRRHPRQYFSIFQDMPCSRLQPDAYASLSNCETKISMTLHAGPMLNAGSMRSMSSKQHQQPQEHWPGTDHCAIEDEARKSQAGHPPRMSPTFTPPNSALRLRRHRADYRRRVRL